MSVKKILLIYLAILCVPCFVFGETIKLGIITDVHYQSDGSAEEIANLGAVTAFVSTCNSVGVNAAIALGDIIDYNTNLGVMQTNIGNLNTAFEGLTGGVPSYYVIGNHDYSGQSLALYLANSSASHIPGQSQNWIADVGADYRIIAWDNVSTGDWAASSTTLTWLATALSDAQTAGKKIILASHAKISQDYPGYPTCQFIGAYALGVYPANAGGTATSSGVSGSVTIAVSTYDALSTEVGKVIFLKHGGVWGYGDITAVDEGTDEYTVTVDPDYPIQSTDATSDWFISPGSIFSRNAKDQREIIDAAKLAGADVCLELNGHSHVASRSEVNEIEEFTMVNGSVSPYGYAILTINDTDDYSFRGYNDQRSWNMPYYVSTTGSDSNSGLGSGDSEAFLTLLKAKNTATYSDTINVAAGTYTEAVTMPTTGTSTYPITYNFASGAIVNKSTSYVLTPLSHTRVYGGSFTGGTISGLHIGTGSTLTNCIIDGAIFYSNVYGAYVEDTSSATDNYIRGCVFRNNTTDGIALISATKVNTCYNLCYSNSRYGIYTTGTAAPAITNNTIAYNLTTGAKFNSTTTPTFRNNITFGNTSYGVDAINTTAACYVQYNDINDSSRMGSSTNDHNITSNPLFVAPLSYNFNLQAGSPCINAGQTARDALLTGKQVDPFGDGYDYFFSPLDTLNIGYDQTYSDAVVRRIAVCGE